METSARYILVGLFTLVVIFAGFGFVYWLNNNSGLGERDSYQIRFLGPVSGLQQGAAVQLNGIRVGEVTGLRLDNDNRVVATIGIVKGVVLRADTGISVDFQGLMGTPLISLRGGSIKAPFLTPDPKAPPVLEAGVNAGQDLTQSARATLGRIDTLLSENSEPIKDTIGSLKTFSAALARNSNRIDAIMAGLEKMTGGSPAEKPSPIYDLAIDGAGLPKSHVAEQFAVPVPTAMIAFDTQRMLTRSVAGEIGQFGEARWSDNIPRLVQAKIVQALGSAGIGAQATTPDQPAEPAGNQLVIALQNFALTTGTPPSADIALSVKLISSDGKITRTHLFHSSALATDKSVPATVAAFNKAMSEVARNLVIWLAGET